MSNLDPAAATAAYLAQLSPDAHGRATAYTQGGHWILLWTAAFSLLIYFVLIRSRLLVRARDRAEARGVGPLGVSALVLGMALVAEAVLSLPWSVYADWARERSYGLSSQAFAGWLGEAALAALLGLPVSLALFVGMYALIRRAPRTWWLWSGALVAGGFVLMMVVAPVFCRPSVQSLRAGPPRPGARRRSGAGQGERRALRPHLHLRRIAAVQSLYGQCLRPLRQHPNCDERRDVRQGCGPRRSPGRGRA